MTTDNSERIGRIRGAAQRQVDAAHFAGIEWLISRKGAIFDRGTEGHADADGAKAIPEGAIYRIYSMTKPVISILALIMVERGLLRLFDPVTKVLPQMAGRQVLHPDGRLEAVNGIMTFEHLLTHRAGLSYDFIPDCPVGALCREAALCDDAGRSLEALAGELARLPLACEPGTRWQYSFAIDLLAHALERLCDRPLREIVKRELLDPLGMADTDYGVPVEKQARLMPMYGADRVAEVLEQALKPQVLRPADSEAVHPADPARAIQRGGHGLFSTAEDYLAFAQFMISGRDREDRRLLSPAMTEMMWLNRIPASQRPLTLGPLVYDGYGWCLFGRVMMDPGQALALTAIGEGGWLGAASTSFWVDRVHDFAGVVMTQYMGSGLGLDKDMQTAAYQALE